MLRLGWFSTGKAKAARDLLEAVQSRIKAGEIKAEIAFVFSNREPGESGESDASLKWRRTIKSRSSATPTKNSEPDSLTVPVGIGLCRPGESTTIAK